MARDRFGWSVVTASRFSYPIVGLILAAGLLGAGVSLILAGEGLETEVQNEVNSQYAACGGSPVVNCSAPAPADQWREYQHGQSLVLDGLVLAGFGVASVMGSWLLWRRPPVSGRVG